jgi:hypothetical protein
MTHTLESLEGLTAKALRPIAADLGVTGASRMKKAEIITAILQAQPTNCVDSGSFEQRKEFVTVEDEGPRDLRLKYTDAELIAADEKRNREANESADEVFAEIAAENLTQTPVLAPKFTVGDRFRIEPAEGVWSVVELIDLDPSGGPGYAWTTEIVEDAQPRAIGTGVTLTEDFLQNDYVTPVAAPPAEEEEYFARMTRRGTETVAVQRVACGRVHFRFIDAKSGRRSAPYDMRETTFRAQYVKVPS